MALYRHVLGVISKTGKGSKIKRFRIYQMKVKKVDYKFE